MRVPSMPEPAAHRAAGLDRRVLFAASGGLSHDLPLPSIATASLEAEAPLIDNRNMHHAGRPARHGRTYDTRFGYAGGTSGPFGCRRHDPRPADDPGRHHAEHARGRLAERAGLDPAALPIVATEPHLGCPVARFDGVDEVASLVLWLAREESSFSTGAAFDA
jgi:hypothetical protein